MWRTAVYTLEVILCCLLSAAFTGRLAYLMFRDLRSAFPWVFGPADDSRADQIRMLTACSAATIADAMFAMNNGYSPVGSVLLMPIAFTWTWELIHTLHRVFGPVLERCVVDWHPVDFGYNLLKQGLAAAWSHQNFSVPGLRRRGGAEEPGPAEAPERAEGDGERDL